MIQSNHSAQDHQPTFFDLVESYKRSSAYIGLSTGSKKEYKKPLERLLEMGSKLRIENHMQLPVAVASLRSHVNFWFEHIMEADIPNYQRGRLVMFVKMVYRSHGLGSLVDSLKLPTDVRATRGEANPLTKATVELIMATENPALKTYAYFVAFLFHTGMRPSEVFNLKWTEVDDKFITVLGSKDREKGVPSRKIPILPEIRVILDYCLTLNSNWVFVSVGRRPLNKDVTCQKVHEIYFALGIKGVLYDARRGVATEMLRKGYSLLNVAHLLGHKSTKTTERYERFTMEEKANSYKGV